MVNFYVNDISVPEDDTAVKKLKDALAKKAEMNIIGYNYQQERSFDTLEGAAKNPGTSGDLMGAGLGLGMGVTMGGAVGGQFGGIAKTLDTNAEDTKSCPSCGAIMPKSKRFCSDCGCDTDKKADKKIYTHGWIFFYSLKSFINIPVYRGTPNLSANILHLHINA